jgi:hypothetical protein
MRLLVVMCAVSFIGVAVGKDKPLSELQKCQAANKALYAVLIAIPI